VTIALVLGWFILIHILEGYVLQPRLVGHSVGVQPTILILAALGAGEVFGLWGALFAAPVAGIALPLITAVWRSWRTQHPEQYPADGEPADATKPLAGKDGSAENATPTSAPPG
jgi:predicted PurR-regulated permease PerM